jgi:hypothetical protein
LAFGYWPLAVGCWLEVEIKVEIKVEVDNDNGD